MGARIEPDEIDVGAIVERLREEVRQTGPSAPAIDGGRPRLRIEARRQAERYAFVTADRPYLYRPGALGRMRGLALVPLKTVLRKLMRWYVEPPLADQRSFNAAVLDLLDQLGGGLAQLDDEIVRRAEALEASQRETAAGAEARHEALGADLARMNRLVHELEERLLVLERRVRQAGDAAPRAAAMPLAAAPANGAGEIGYFAFESRMRGSVEHVREKQRRYVEEFRDAAPVLDVGCGRGEFVALLGEAGIEARGIDPDPDMVAFARGDGLDVEQADALAYLPRLDDGSLGGVFVAHVLEHLAPAELLRLLELAAAKVRAGGLLVVETINPLSPLALRNYFADLTHRQPLVPETLVMLVRQAGFARVETRFLNEPAEHERLRPVELPAEPAFAAARAALAANVARLNDVLFGPLDYAILART